MNQFQYHDMEDTTPSYEQLYMDHQRVLAEYYRDSVDFHKQIIQLKDELAEAKQQLSFLISQKEI